MSFWPDHDEVEIAYQYKNTYQQNRFQIYLLCLQEAYPKPFNNKNVHREAEC